MCEKCGQSVKIEVPDIITVPGFVSDSPEQEAFERRERAKADMNGRYGQTPIPATDGVIYLWNGGVANGERYADTDSMSTDG